MSISHTTGQSIRTAAVAALATLAGFSAQAETTASGETYDWSATLVSFDGDAGTAVLQARIESYVDIGNLDAFEDGDRVTLVWTGRNWAAGVRDIVEGRDIPEDALVLPVEFVAPARDGDYLNFRVRVPESAMALLADFEAGTRVTGISPKTLGQYDSAVVSMRHYNDLS